uniref:Uncharacterized protein n=1 Tax=Oryza brachyantha TaxID=4533 RepID=J3LEW1_ORYBR
MGVTSRRRPGSLGCLSNWRYGLPVAWAPSPLWFPKQTGANSTHFWFPSENETAYLYVTESESESESDTDSASFSQPPISRYILPCHAVRPPLLTPLDRATGHRAQPERLIETHPPSNPIKSRRARGSGARGSAAGQSRCGYFGLLRDTLRAYFDTGDYFGLLRDTLQAYFDTDYSLTVEELLADILIANMAEKDMDNALTSDVPQCSDISDSEEDLPPGCVTPRMSTLDPKQCGGSFREHLDMLCDCCYYTHAAAAGGGVDVDVEIAVNAMGFNEIAHDLKEAIEAVDLEDAVTEMALDMDAAPAAADIDEFLNAFDEIARDLKDFIEAMDREDA